MARPREFDEDDVLERAVRVFWEKGYGETSIQDLEAATGLKRGSIYNAFGDKARLFDEAFDRYLEGSKVCRHLRRAGDRPATEALDGLFELLIEDALAHGNGCLFTNSIVEFGSRDPAMAIRLGKAQKSTEDMLADLIGRAQTEGGVAAKLEPRTAARFLLAMIHGIRVMSKTQPGEEALRAVAATARGVLAPGPTDNPLSQFIGQFVRRRT